MKTSNKVLCPKERVIYVYSSKSGYRFMAAGKIGVKVFAMEYSLPLNMLSNLRSRKTSIAFHLIHLKEVVRNSMWYFDRYGELVGDEISLFELQKKHPDVREPDLDAYPTKGIISDKVFQ